MNRWRAAAADMARLRLLVWLFALVALAIPPASILTGAPAAAQTMAVDCFDHDRLDQNVPASCPDRGSTKHAAGLCCSPMAGSVALVEKAPGVTAVPLHVIPSPIAVAFGAGLLFTQDPPPPRA